ncbi:MAG: redoxin domain-containing protein [Syntrophaceae bacterium]|nr:redoxin domain-containing protein [Syntrophaceae bacterium]
MARVELSVNTQAPDFTLTDYTGQSVSLSDNTGKKNILVVFNRGFL